jgi:hypothetical protein
MSELREEACAVGTVGGHLAPLVVGQPSQGRRQIEGGLGQDHAEQEAPSTQTQGQHRQRRPGRSERERVSVRARGGPPLSPVSPLGSGRKRRRHAP